MAQGGGVGLAGGDSLVVHFLADGSLFQTAAEAVEVMQVSFADAVRIDEHATRGVFEVVELGGSREGEVDLFGSHHVEQDQLVTSMTELGQGLDQLVGLVQKVTDHHDQAAA